MDWKNLKKSVLSLRLLLKMHFQAAIVWIHVVKWTDGGFILYSHVSLLLII